jgi:hypothetical protein
MIFDSDGILENWKTLNLLIKTNPEILNISDNMDI